MLNRSLVTVKAKEPLRQWLLSLPDPCDHSLEQINEDPAAYLLPVYEDDNHRDRIIKKFFVLIFEYQLAEWWTREEDWPAKRDFRTFKQWFDYEFHSVIDDLVNAPLLDD